MALLPVHTATAEGLTAAIGSAFTVTVLLAVAVQLLPSVTVTVYVVNAFGDTVFAAVFIELLHAKLCPPLAVSVVLVLLQIAIVAGLIFATGKVFTVTFALAVAVQLLASVTVTVYGVFTKGETVIAVVFAALLQV